MNGSRVWRDLAIGWFDAMNREIGRHFARSFLDELHRAFNVGTEEELLDLRFECDMRRRRVDEIVRTPKEDRLIGGAWEFHLLCETFFVAICDLALEDFRYKRFVVYFYKMIDDEEPCDSAIVTASTHFEDAHIYNVACRMTVERGMQTLTYEETL